MRRWKLLLSVLMAVVLVFGSRPQAARAAESAVSGAPALSLEEAIDLALENDKSLQKAQVEIERLKKLRDKVAEGVEFIPAESGTYDAEIESSWYSLLSTDLSWRASQKEYEAKVDAIILDVCKKYWDVQVAAQEMLLQEKLKEQARISLENARAGAAAGTVASSTVIAAEAEYQKAVKSYEQARHTLDNAYTAFNHVVGLDPAARPELTDEVKFEPLEVDSLDAAVSRVLEKAPDVWSARQNIDLKRWAASMVYYSGSYTPYEARQKELQEAELDYARVKELMAKGTRSIYYQAKQAEEGYAAAVEALKAAQEKVRVARAQYEVGTATRADVVAAEVAVMQAQVSLDQLVRNHAYLKLAFEKPWAASS
ncbi:MAG: TolC family protein [Moorellaceae bacterium]